MIQAHNYLEPENTQSSSERSATELKRGEAVPQAAQGEDGSSPGPLRRIVEMAGHLGDVLAAVLVLLLAGSIGYEVIARYFFNSPTGFANQFAAYVMPCIAFLAAAAALRENAHVAVDILVSALPERRRAVLAIVTELFSVILLVAVTYYTVLVIIDTYQSGTRTFSTVLTFPEYLPQMVMPLGFALLTLQQSIQLIDAIRRYRRRRVN